MILSKGSVFSFFFFLFPSSLSFPFFFLSFFVLFPFFILHGSLIVLDRLELCNARNNYGETPLHYAALNGDEELIRLLLEYVHSPSLRLC